jgi:glucose/arabinose dehydrogenase
VRRLFWAAAVTVPLIAAPMSIGMVYSLAAPAPAITVVASRLENPRGLVFGPDGKLYVAEGGLGGNMTTNSPQLCQQVPDPVGPYSGGMTSRISKVDVHSGRRTTVIAGLPSSQTNAKAGSLVSGVSDVAFVGHHLYAITAGSGCSHGLAGTSNAVLRIDGEDHKATQVADLSAFLATHRVAHPGLDFEPDGTWYSMISVGENLYAVEPNHGEIDRITQDGDISRVVDVSATQGHIVPTGLAFDHGRFDLVNLDVFDPGAVGHAGLFHVTRHGKISSVASGLTAAVSVAVHDGHVYALEAFTGSFAPMPSDANTGTVVRLGKSGAWDVVATGLSFPTAMTFGPDGDLYVSNKGFGQPTNTAGEIVRIELPEEGRDDD